MSTASGYSDRVEEASVRRATGPVTGGASGGATGAGSTAGGASRSSPGLVLSSDQSEEPRDVPNASMDAREVRLESLPDGGLKIVQSIGETDDT